MHPLDSLRRNKQQRQQEVNFTVPVLSTLFVQAWAHLLWLFCRQQRQAHEEEAEAAQRTGVQEL
jgi:predicted metal-binding membrane protein